MENKENLYASIPYVDKKVSRIFAGTAFSPIQDGADGTDFLRRRWPMESMLLIRQGYIWKRSIPLATGWKRVADGKR